MNKEANITFTPGERLDKTLAQLYPEYSRSALEKLITNEKVLVNRKPAKTKYTLKGSDTLSVDFAELEKAIEKIDLPIVFEDDDVLVISKPLGILAHSKGEFSKEGTVASFIQTKLTGSEAWKSSNRAGIVHRLDRATSGVMICAKNEDAQTFLQKQFSKRNVKKTYLAVILGELDETEGLIDVPIERNPKKPATFRAGINGKTAQTEFKVIKTGQSMHNGTNSIYSLVELHPKTGRTHQLRVHLAYLKHPIVGDDFYKGEVAERLMLHAARLEITLPSSKRTTFTVELPEIFNEYVYEAVTTS